MQPDLRRASRVLTKEFISPLLWNDPVSLIGTKDVSTGQTIWSFQNFFVAETKGIRPARILGKADATKRKKCRDFSHLSKALPWGGRIEALRDSGGVWAVEVVSTARVLRSALPPPADEG